MGRMQPLVLAMTLCTTSLAAQGRTPGHDAGSVPFHTGLAATILPIAAGVGLIAASHGHAESGTANAGVLLITGGVLLGPSIGNWAGGLGGRGFLGFGLRTVAVVGGVVGGFAASWNNNDSAGGAALFIGGLAVTSGLVVWDLATVKGAARRRQARSVSMLPTVRPGTHEVGLAVRVSF